MQTHTTLLSELMAVQHRKALLSLETEHLEEREKFINQTMSLSSPDLKKETPAAGKKEAVKGKGKKETAAIEAASEDDDADEVSLDDVFGSEDDADEVTIGDDEVRTLLASIIKSKGADGKKKCRVIMAKYTKNQSALVKDILKGSHAKIHAALTKI